MTEISTADFEEFFNQEGIKYQDYGIGFKHGTGFGSNGMEYEIELLERELGFKYPADYLAIITEDGTWANGHFRSGWWRVKNTQSETILWSFSLSLKSHYGTDTFEKERTLPIQNTMKQSNYDHIPFGDGFRVNKKPLTNEGNMTVDDGWLYFDRSDATIHFIDKKFKKKTDLSPHFTQMIYAAELVCYA